MAKINWTLQQFRLDELTDYYKNPRSLSEKEFKQLKTSLDKFGMIDKPIVNADSAHTIIGGHQRKHVLETSGVKEVECWIPDRELSDKEVEELNIRLNKNTGSWDFDTLANEFELDDLLDWGFEKGELDLGLWADEPPEDVEPQIDKAEELREKWGVKLGDLWKLGEHRLICGDCTDKAVVDKVMQGERAKLLMADPPYNVKYTGGSTNEVERADSYEDDMSDADYTSWLFALLKNGFECTDDKAALMLWFASAKMRCIMDGFENAGWIARTLIVWNKTKAHYGALGAQYKHKYEPMWYCFKKGCAPRFYGATNETTVWDFDQPRVNDLHPTMKPIELYERCVRNHSETSDEVLELFSGSGTTLIACERLNRKCRAVEISPAYCAVAIQRWVDVTGKEPVLLDT